MKLICGLYAPAAGEILLDGKPISYWGVKRFRKSFGIVLQDDVLLSGSIAENVSGFVAQTDRNRVWECIKAVGLEDEVVRMPLGLDTQIVDIGSTLSGGQSQRVQIARALYHAPPILLLDEATSHLDPSSEEHIAKILSEYKGTRIVIAHSERVIKGADRVLTLRDGVLVDPDPPKRPVRGYF
jgi:ATP-binding cassette subfamily B protein RaxB